MAEGSIDRVRSLALVVALLCGLPGSGCGDDGEAPDAGSVDAGGPSDAGGPMDGGPPADAGRETVDAGPVGEDAGAADAGAADAGAADAGAEDAGGEDAGAADAGVVDAGAEDAGTPDAGAADAGVVDAGAEDAGTPDAGTADAGAVDAGVEDAGGTDAGAPDAATDAGGAGGTTDICGACVADADCVVDGFGARRCIPTELRGELHSHRCMVDRATSAFCPQPTVHEVVRTSVGGVTSTYCVHDESRTTCAAIEDFGDTCTRGASDCGDPAVSDSRCELLRCTYPCDADDDCPFNCSMGAGARYCCTGPGRCFTI